MALTKPPLAKYSTQRRPRERGATRDAAGAVVRVRAWLELVFQRIARRFDPRALERCLFVLCCLSLGVFTTHSALADSPLILFDAGTQSELARELHAEAAAVELAFTAHDTRDTPLTQSAVDEGASAALRIPDETKVELVAVRKDGSLRHWHVYRRSEPGYTFAVDVIEQLRGALVEFDWLPKAEPTAVAPAAEEREAPTLGVAPASTTPTAHPFGPAEPTPSELRLGAERPLWISLGFAATLAAGGAGVTPHADVAVRLEQLNWALTGRALLPLAENEFTEPEGDGELDVNLFVVEASAVWRQGRHWLLESGPGGGVVVLPMESDAVAPYVGNSEQRLATVLYLHGSAALRLTDWLRLRAGARFGFSAPRPVVRFARREVVSWGRLVSSLGVGAEFAFPRASNQEPVQ